MTAATTTVLLLVLAVLAPLPWSTGRRAASLRAGPVPSGSRPRRRPVPVDEAVVLDLVRATLAAGHGVVTAVEAVGSVLPEPQGARFVRAARALRLGSSWEVAWPQSCAVAAALAPAWRDGVDPEPLLLHAAAAMRRSRQARSREAAARLGVRLVLPLGLCLLPAFVLLGLVPLLISAGLELWAP